MWMKWRRLVYSDYLQGLNMFRDQMINGCKVSLSMNKHARGDFQCLWQKKRHGRDARAEVRGQLIKLNSCHRLPFLC